MKRNLLAALVVLTLGASSALAQNALKNPSFEDPTIDTGSAIGKWFRFDSGAGGDSVESTVDPLTGARHIALSTIGANQFAGVFQTLENPALPGGARPIGPGAVVTFSGFHHAVGATNQTSELKIEWTGAPQNRVDIINVAVGPYLPFLHSGVAPAGTTGATITYAISTFGPGQNTTALVHIDDFLVTVVPEPATMGMIGMSALGLVGVARRRRK
jgi:hypothetical protein